MSTRTFVFGLFSKASLLIAAIAGIQMAMPEEAKALAPTLRCTIRTYNGRYLTAVGGGGRITDVIHSDATRARAWEYFDLVDSGTGQSYVEYGFRTATRNFLTVVGGGGRITDVIHSDARSIQAWERITPIALGGSWYALRTTRGNYLTAVGGGGRITDVIHSDATRIGNWEKFSLNCRTIRD